ncbi:hypothetical protein FRC09_011576 [Ceratobasidium sp. 395]|nr:hypothetical protein FRC09_011576 [Ceratobasidium sp. 395]
MVAGNTTRFTSRSGSHKFREATQTNGYTSLVNNWHKNAYNQQDVSYQCTDLGSAAHLPRWQAIPTIMDEVHPQYVGYGSSQAKAKEESAQKIANSGHC